MQNKITKHKSIITFPKIKDLKKDCFLSQPRPTKSILRQLIKNDSSDYSSIADMSSTSQEQFSTYCHTPVKPQKRITVEMLDSETDN